MDYHSGSCFRDSPSSQISLHLRSFCFQVFFFLPVIFLFNWASLVAQLVMNPPAIRETWVWSLGWEDPLKKGKATHSSILTWTFHGLQSMGSQRVRYDWVTFTSLHFFFHNWSPISDLQSMSNGLDRDRLCPLLSRLSLTGNAGRQNDI